MADKETSLVQADDTYIPANDRGYYTHVRFIVRRLSLLSNSTNAGGVLRLGGRFGGSRHDEGVLYLVRSAIRLLFSSFVLSNSCRCLIPQSKLAMAQVGIVILKEKRSLCNVFYNFSGPDDLFPSWRVKLALPSVVLKDFTKNNNPTELP